MNATIYIQRKCNSYQRTDKFAYHWMDLALGRPLTMPCIVVKLSRLIAILVSTNHNQQKYCFTSFAQFHMWWINGESREPCLDRQSDNYVFVPSFFCAIFVHFSVDQCLNIFLHFIVSSYTLLRYYVAFFFTFHLLARVIFIQCSHKLRANPK